MSQGISLEQARIQLNMPYASEAEVRTAAQANNLVIIDFGGSNNPSSVTIGSDITLFGGAQSSSVSGDDIYGGMVSLGNINRTPVTPSNNPITPAVRGGSSVSSSPQISVEDLMQNQNLGEIRLVNGRLVAFDKNGNEITDTQGRSLGISGTLREGLSSIEFRNGKVIQKDKDGRVISEDAAAAGQVGYQKDGESIEERLARFNGKSVEEIQNMSSEERRNLEERYFKWCKETHGEKVAKSDFYKLVKNTGMDAAHMRDYAITVLHMDESEADEVINEFAQKLYTKEAQAEFLNGIVDNVGMVNNPQMQATVTRAVTDAARTAGISAEVVESIGNAITTNKYHSKDACIEALRSQYGLSAEKANEFYMNLPEDVRQQIEDGTLDAITTVQTEVAADGSQPESVRRDAADLSTGYATYIDDAAYQMQVLRNNSDYIMQNADEDMQQYYTNSIANNAYNYDISNRDEIIRMVKELGTERTLEILENARKEYEAKAAQDQANAEARRAEAQRQQEQQAQVANNNSTPTAGKVYSSSELKSMAKEEGWGNAFKNFKGLKSQDIADVFADLEGAERQEIIGEYVEQASVNELQNLMASSLRNDILSYLVKHNTGDNKRKLETLQRSLTTVSDRIELANLQRENAPIQDTSPGTGDGNSNNNPFKFGFITRH